MTSQPTVNPEDLIRVASPDGIVDRMREVAIRMRRWKRWLNQRHPYNDDVLEALNHPIDAPKVAEYIASSAPLHLVDGWSYLSRAFDAACRGDRSPAIHLAYYAELRAAMSLLATEGIGIFNREHIALDHQLNPTTFRATTHQATWKLLKAWANEPGKAGKILESISIDGKNLSDWLGIIGVVTPSQQLLAMEWLQTWSIDLETISNDPRRRNEMSYRPTRIRVPTLPPVDPHKELRDPIFDSWTELDPEFGGNNVALDLSLLRHGIMLVVKRGLCNYNSFDSAMRSLSVEMRLHTHQALAQSSPSAASIFRDAAVNNVRDKSATPILARALLLLRIASACTSSLLESAEVSKQDLQFWWSPLGTDLGLWEKESEIETFSDLWQDVVDAKYEADSRISDIRGDVSVKAVASILAEHLSLTQFSRAPMWLLDLD